MRVLVSRVGGLAETVSVLPTLDALVDGLDDAEITVLCSPDQAGLITMSVPGIRPVAIAPADIQGSRGLLRVPGLARQIGTIDVALIPPGECGAVHALARLVAHRRIGFPTGAVRGERMLTEALPFDRSRSVADQCLDLARYLLDWDTMPLHRVAPLPSFDSFTAEPYGVLHPGALLPQQRWGEERFAALHQCLPDRTGFPWRLIREDDYDLIDLAALLAGATMFVGCHAGPLQLAAAQGVPWVAICGSTTPAWDPPWSDVPGIALRLGPGCQPCGGLGGGPLLCDHQRLCLDAVGVDDAVHAIDALLSLVAVPVDRPLSQISRHK